MLYNLIFWNFLYLLSLYPNISSNIPLVYWLERSEIVFCLKHLLFTIIVCSSHQRLIMVSIYKYSLSVCLYPINVKTAEPIRPKFCVGPQLAPGKVYQLSKFLKFAIKSFYILYNVVYFCFILFKERRCSQIKPQLKVEIEDGREAP